MNMSKVVFGFFVLLALTLNFGFFLGDIDNPAHVGKMLQGWKKKQAELAGPAG